MLLNRIVLRIFQIFLIWAWRLQHWEAVCVVDLVTRQTLRKEVDSAVGCAIHTRCCSPRQDVLDLETFQNHVPCGLTRSIPLPGFFSSSCSAPYWLSCLCFGGVSRQHFCLHLVVGSCICTCKCMQAIRCDLFHVFEHSCHRVICSLATLLNFRFVLFPASCLFDRLKHKCCW